MIDFLYCTANVGWSSFVVFLPFASNITILSMYPPFPLLFILLMCNYATIVFLLLSFHRFYRLFLLFFRSLQHTDGHNDLPWNIRRYANNRLEYLNLSEGLDQTAPWSTSKWSQTDFKRLKEGLVGAQFW